MIDLLDVEKRLLLPHSKTGGTVVDFTMGNGHDTLWLARTVGPEGKVYSFDVQKQALDNTRALLDAEGVSGTVRLILDSHENVDRYVTEKICAGMFNLGWLPGSDRTVTTRADSSLAALKKAIGLLDADGAILVAVYPGHPEGTKEGILIEQYLSGMDRRNLCCSKFRIINSPTSPFFFLIEKKAL